MRVLVAAVGRLKQGPERELAERYLKRAADLGRKNGLKAIDIVEIKQQPEHAIAKAMHAGLQAMVHDVAHVDAGRLRHAASPRGRERIGSDR